MLFRKKEPNLPQPFSRIFASRWLVEYAGVLPHCSRQGSAIAHHLFCARLDPKHKWLLLEEGVEVTGATNSTHVLWCFTKLDKDRGEIRLLFRRYLDISQVAGIDWQNWVAFKLTQHLQEKLMEISDFYLLIPCNRPNEYTWCAEEDDLSSYWEMEIASKLKRLKRSRRSP